MEPSSIVFAISGPFSFLASDVRISIPITAAVIISNLPGRDQFIFFGQKLVRSLGLDFISICES